MAQGVPTTLPNPFHTLPHTPSIPITPYKVNIPQEKIDDLKRRINDAPTPRRTFENSHTDEPLGLTRDWLLRAIEEWKSFDWRKVEEEINSFPQFTAKVKHNGDELDVHFLAMFSKDPKAIPIVFSHGWPGSILEFIPLLHHLSKTYTPDTLPIHAIVPSLIGYGFSSPPPIDKDFTTKDNANVFNDLMLGLGFDQYMAQGGDVGSYISRFLGAEHPSCKAVHVNMFVATTDPTKIDQSKLDQFDQDCIARWQDFAKWEFAYKHEHATKSGTIGFVLESSPIALLSWVGEKFLVWSDKDPSIHTILSDISLYWFQNSISTGLYHYRSTGGRRSDPALNFPKVNKNVSLGYSLFKKEIIPVPEFVAKEADGSLVWFKRHEEGGHFAALEEPVTFWEDILDFTEKTWKST